MLAAAPWRSDWRRVLPAFALLLAAVLWLYRDTAVAMVTIWARSETFAHAFTVPPIVAWLIWRRRHALATVRPRPSAWALPLLFVAGLVWLLGDLASANAATQLAFTAMLVLAVPALLGSEVARTLLFPLGFLFFAVPLGEFMLPQLMEWTAGFTVLALRLSGIPVYREGLQFVIPSGNWSVVEACSGIRYLIASVMIGVLFAYLNYRSPRRRWIFVGVAIVVPLLANWVRAYLIVLLGHVSNNQLATGVDHLIYGWLFFGVVIGSMFFIGARWAEPEADDDALAASPSPSPSPRAAPPSAAWAVAATAAALVVAPQLALALLDAPPRPGAPRLAMATSPAPGWRLDEAAATDWKPAFKGSAAELNTRYVDGAGQPVDLYIAYYQAQDYEHKLISSDNVLVTLQDTRWSQAASGTHEVPIDGQDVTPGQILRVRTARLRASAHPGQAEGTPLIAWQIYWVNGEWTSSDARARVHAVWQRLLGRGDAAAAVVISAPQHAGADTDALLASFLRANLHVLGASLRKVRDGD